MNHFFYKLIPPRRNFHLNQNAEEQEIMQKHFGYWSELTSTKKALIYGPVFHKDGVFGIAIIASESEEEAKNIANNDPAILSKIHTYELSPMLLA